MGNRIGKIEKPRDGVGVGTELSWKYTWYTLDAQGQTLATNYMDYELVSGSTYQANYQTQEEFIYGSSRLGVLNTETTLPVKTRQFTSSGFGSDGRFIITQWATEQIGPSICIHCAYPGSRTLGYKQYELTDHLGNVLATVSDLKNYVLANDRFEADIVSCQDYFPFGMLMNNRQEFPLKYRFGFNGQEADNEIKGTGNSLEFKYRIYDSRLGKFLSVDPLFAEYPWNSTYAFAENDVISCIDLEGAEKLRVIKKSYQGVPFISMKYIMPPDRVTDPTLGTSDYVEYIEDGVVRRQQNLDVNSVEDQINNTQVTYYDDAGVQYQGPLNVAWGNNTSPPYINAAGQTIKPKWSTLKVDIFGQTKVNFYSGKSSLNASGIEGNVNEQLSGLDRLGQLLVDNPNAIVYIGGFTDRDDTNDNNQTLSNNRVQAGVDYLKNKYGIDQSRFRTQSNGEDQANQAQTESNDRRIDITVTTNPLP